MKAAVTTGEKREIIVNDIPKPQVQPGTLLLKTKYCSICGSDLEYLSGSLELFHKPGYELHAGAILGHEFSAEVAEVGEGVEGWSVGDRVAVGGGRQGCGQCYFCRRGLHRLCLGEGVSPRAVPREVTPYGTKSGAMAEYFIRPATALQKVPDNVSDEEVALVEPLSNGVASVEAAGLKPGDSAVVIGAGKIGLGAMLCAKAAGVAPVVVIDLIKSRLDKALEMGADAVLNANEIDVIAEVAKLTNGAPDAVLVCVREGKVLDQAADMVRRGGIVVVTGILAPSEVNPFLWLMKNLRLASHLGGPSATSLRLIANKQVNVKPLISEIMPLEDVQRAFDSMWSGKNIAVLLKI
jgi:(R,R)-butanediol dehydrogenase/meso-butanediol dehydrogenase/diacetyl reductase